MNGTGISGGLLAERPKDVLLSRNPSSARLPEPTQHRELPYEFKVGDRVRLSTVGRARCPRSISAGRIVGLVARRPGYGSVRVLWDGLTAPRRLHTSYIEIDEDGASNGNSPIEMDCRG